MKEPQRYHLKAYGSKEWLPHDNGPWILYEDIEKRLAITATLSEEELGEAVEDFKNKSRTKNFEKWEKHWADHLEGEKE